MKICWSILFLLAFGTVWPQQIEVPDFNAVDSLYREDQFYFSFTYNILNGKDAGISQNKFSPGITAGFLRDMPVNDDRTISIAAGLGYAFHNYNYNLIVSEDGSVRNYELIAPDIGYDKNRLTLHFVELPIEFRWRTSTFESHKFWRVYTGVKLSYLFASQSKYVSTTETHVVSNNKDLTALRYGVYLATGYNTWNFTIYYGLNPIFDSAQLNGKSIDVKTLNLGLMFYIL